MKKLSLYSNTSIYTDITGLLSMKAWRALYEMQEDLMGKVWLMFVPRVRDMKEWVE